MAHMISHVPDHVNFFIYVRNLYLNRMAGEFHRFPWLPVTEAGLLDQHTFVARAEKLWMACSNNRALEDEFSDRKEPAIDFSSLFTEDEQGKDNFSITKKAFHSWFDSIGYQSLDKMGINWIPYLDQTLAERCRARGITLREEAIYVHFIYDHLPAKPAADCHHIFATAGGLLDPGIQGIDFLTGHHIINMDVDSLIETFKIT